MTRDAMDGEHRGGRTHKDVVVGSKAAAAQQRKRAQHGAAAAARKGHVVRRARAASKQKHASDEEAAIAQEVEHSMKKGTDTLCWAQNGREGWDRRFGPRRSARARRIGIGR